MKLFLTIFGAIIAASIALAIIAAIVIAIASADLTEIFFIGAMIAILAFPILIDRALSRYGA